MAFIDLLIFLFGAVLGMRFKVFILIPAIALSLLVVLPEGLSSGSGLVAALGAAALGAIFLQLGYVGGSLARHSIIVARAQRLRKDLRQVEPVR
jgi:hypothetical protein